jgi:hypothetical protein
MEPKKVTRDNILYHLLEYELKMAGDEGLILLIECENWRYDVTMTTEQFIEFRKYAIALLQKIFKFRREKALNTFDWFWRNFGLRIKN